MRLETGDDEGEMNTRIDEYTRMFGMDIRIHEDGKGLDI